MLPLIAPKPCHVFTPEEFHSYISSMYALPTRSSSAKPKSPVSGLTVSRNKKGELTVRRTAKQRAFPYATIAEVKRLANHVKCSQADLWSLLKSKEFILGPDRLSCERIWAELQGLPF